MWQFLNLDLWIWHQFDFWLLSAFHARTDRQTEIWLTRPLKVGYCIDEANIFCLGGGMNHYVHGGLAWRYDTIRSMLTSTNRLAGYDKERYFSENPNYLGCQGDCKRWFHAYCLGLNYRKYIVLSQRSYWQCNRYDCKLFKS